MQFVLNRSEGEVFTVDVEPMDTFQNIAQRIKEETGSHFNIEQLNVDCCPISSDQYISEVFSAEQVGVSCNETTGSYNEVLLTCAVPRCSSTDNLIFPFPSESERCHHWVAVCGRYDLMKKPPDYVSRRYGVCSRHFINDSFKDSSKYILKDDAVPTIFEVNNDINIGANDNNQHNKRVNNMVIYNTGEKRLLLKPKSKIEVIGNENNSVNEDNIDDCPVEKMCRLCAKTSVEFHYIFGDEGEKKKLAEKINRLLPITVSLRDPLPKQLCIECVEKVYLFHEFSESCLKADKELDLLCRKKKFLSKQVNGLLVLPRVHSASDPKNLQLEPIRKNNIKSMPNYNCPLCCNGKMLTNSIIKKGKKGIHCELSECIDDTFFSECNQNLITPDHKDSKSSEDRILSSEDRILSSKVSAEECDNNDVLIVTAFENSKDSIKVMCCVICEKLFDNLELCLNHSKDHSLSGVFPCSRCELCFSEESSFNSHVEEHRNESLLRLCVQCRTCKKQFNDEFVYNSHPCISQPLSLLSVGPFKCLECGRFFRTESRLLFHTQCHLDGTSVIGCEYCGKVFSRETNLFEHVQSIHMDKKSYLCHICEKYFQLKTCLITHLRMHFGERSFQCSVCSEKFCDSETFKCHLIAHLYNKASNYDKFKELFSRESLFKQNVAAHHSKFGNKKVYLCKLCDTTFPSMATIAKHKKQVHNVGIAIKDKRKSVSKQFTCGVCGKSFAHRITLVAHNRHHTGELPYQCEFCGKKFTQNQSLSIHLRIHTGEKPYHCSVCGKKFSQTSHLYTHERLHTGEKPYSCKICGQSFRLKYVKDCHERKHTGERPFKCHICEKAFRTSHSFYQHMWIHEGKRPYSCKVCGKSFTRSNGLKIHFRIHTGEKPYVCEICNKSFAQKQELKKHENSHLCRKT